MQFRNLILPLIQNYPNSLWDLNYPTVMNKPQRQFKLFRSETRSISQLVCNTRLFAFLFENVSSDSLFCLQCFLVILFSFTIIKVSWVILPNSCPWYFQGNNKHYLIPFLHIAVYWFLCYLKCSSGCTVD